MSNSPSVEEVEQLLGYIIVNHPDFPKKGINFKDLMPLFRSPFVMGIIEEALIARFSDQKIDVIIAPESRGIVLATLLAKYFHAKLVIARKPGKLPCEVKKVEYSLEYGTGYLEIPADAIRNGENVLIHDDLLATGGSAEAAAKLVEMSGGIIIGFCFIVSLLFLNGEEKLKRYSKKIHYLKGYKDGE